MPSPVSVSKRTALEGGFLTEPVILPSKECFGKSWLPLVSSSPVLTEFLTGEPYSKRPLSETSVLEVLKAARDDARTQECIGFLAQWQTSQDVASESLLIFLSGEDPGTTPTPEKGKVKKSKKKEHDAAMQQVDAVPYFEVQVPQAPGSEEFATVTLLNEKGAVSIEPTEEALTWLLNFVVSQRAAGVFKRQRHGHQHEQRITSGEVGVTWAQMKDLSNGWQVTWRNASKKREQKFIRVRSKPEDPTFETDKQDALMQAIEWRRGHHCES